VLAGVAERLLASTRLISAGIDGRAPSWANGSGEPSPGRRDASPG
jgi:hypothetical protein